jgi:hypothetical protein
MEYRKCGCFSRRVALWCVILNLRNSRDEGNIRYLTINNIREIVVVTLHDSLPRRGGNRRIGGMSV